MTLKQLYARPGRTVVTAHRGWSGRYPENTLCAFREAVGIGADVVEFDVRGTADGELVVIHDESLDRTTDGTGPVRERTLAELKPLNATFWRGPHDTGYRSATPAGDESIPTLRETLSALAGRVGMNVQVYTADRDALRTIVGLFTEFRLHDSAFLMLNSFGEADYVRRLDPRVPVCTGEDRADVEKQLRRRMDFLQPAYGDLTEEYVARARAAGARVNVFYANTAERARLLVDAGIPGILTDCPDVVILAAGPGRPRS